MKYKIRIETNVAADKIKDVGTLMTDIASTYGHKPENLLVQVQRFIIKL